MKKKNKLPLALKIVIVLFLILTVNQVMMISNIMFSSSSNLDVIRNFKKYKALYKKVIPVISQSISQRYFNMQDSSGNSLFEAIKNGTGAYKPIKICRGNCSSSSERWTAISRTNQLYFGNDDGYTFFYKDGSALMLPKAAFANVSCIAQNIQIPECTGAIDINGKKEPNQIVTCDDGNPNSDACNVSVPTDVYPVVIYNAAIHPATQAASTVFYSY